MKDVELQEINWFILQSSTINESELKKYILSNFPNKSEKYFNYYLSDLYKNNIIYKYDIDIFKSCNDKKDFVLTNSFEEKVRAKLENIEPPIYISVWQLADLNKYMSLQIFSDIKFIETYGYATDVVLNVLLTLGKNVVFEKDYKTYIKYNKCEELYIVRTINEDSPINRKRAFSKDKSIVVSPKIEKIIVDIIVDDLFEQILADETYRILYELFKNYKINISTIKRYATKKHRWENVKMAIESIGFNIETGELK